MKAVFITYLTVFLIPNLLFGQEQVAQKDTVSFYRNHFSIELGMHYNFLTGNRYIELVPDPGIDDNVWAGYTKMSKIGTHFGFSYNYRLYKKLFIQSGVFYMNRLSILQNNADTIAKYKNKHINIIEAQTISSNEIDLPLYIGYNWKRVSLMAGTKNRVFYIPKEKTAFIDGEFRSFFHRKNGGSYYALYPSVKLSYDVNYHKALIGIYIAADRRSGFYQCYDILFGLYMKILNK